MFCRHSDRSLSVPVGEESGPQSPKEGGLPVGTDAAGRGKEAKPKPPDVGHPVGESR